MKHKVLVALLAGLLAFSLGGAQNPPEKTQQAAAPQGAYDLADALARRLGTELNVKTSVGDPIKVGSVTLIPILMINVSFGGGGMSFPGGAPAAAVSPSAAPAPAAKTPPAPQSAPAAKPAAGADGFFMSGEARPLGFVAVTAKGTRFMSVGKTVVK